MNILSSAHEFLSVSSFSTVQPAIDRCRNREVYKFAGQFRISCARESFLPETFPIQKWYFHTEQWFVEINEDERWPMRTHAFDTH